MLLTSLGDATVDAIRLEISERAANRRGLRPVEADADEAGLSRRRPLPPLPPEVKAARDALAAQEPLPILEGNCI